MNKTYRLVFSRRTNAWVAVAEICTGQGKAGGSRRGASLKRASVLLCGGAALCLASLPAPARAKVADGKAPCRIDGSLVAHGYGAVSAWGDECPGRGHHAAMVALRGGTLAATYHDDASGEGARAGTASRNDPRNTEIGSGAVATGQGAMAIGAQSKAAGEYSMTLGAWSKASGKYAAAIGYAATASPIGSVAIGDWAVADEAVGTPSATINGQTYAFAGGAPMATMSIGSNRGLRTITRVAAGRISSSSTDATNGSQLNATNVALSRIGTDISGFKASMSTGMSSISSSLSSVASGISSLSTGSARDLENAVKYDNASRESVSLGNAASAKPVKLTNLADGRDASDAVTVRQLSVAYRGLTSLSTSTASLSDGVMSLSTGLSHVTSLVADTENVIRYDDESQESVTFGNLLSVKPVKLTNVADGARLNDAVTVRQLSQTNSGVASLSTGAVATNKSVNSLSTGLRKMVGLTAGIETSVQYDDDTQGVVTFGSRVSARPVILTNVAEGVNATDAVNVRQMSATNSRVGSLSTGMAALSKNVGSLSTGAVSLGQGLTSLSTGATALSDRVTSLSTGLSKATALATDVERFVQYDTTQRARLTLGGTSARAPVKLGNVADGETPRDAVNFGQLGEVSRHVESLSTGAVVLGQGVTSLSTGAVSLGQGLTSLSTGAVVLGQGVTSLSTGAVVLGQGLTSLSTGAVSLSQGVTSLSTGLSTVAALTADISSFAKYDSDRRDMLTLGGKNPTAPVALTNLADGVRNSDAVTVRQLGVTNSNVMRLSTSMATFEIGVGSLSTGMKSIGGTVESLVSEMEIAVQYDNATKTKLRLGGLSRTPVSLGNVADGTRPNDAVNAAQLGTTNSTVASLSTTLSGLVAPGAVVRSANGRSHRTLVAGGVAATGEHNQDGAVTLANVADGERAGDAVNFAQLSATNRHVGSISTSIDKRVGALSTRLNKIERLSQGTGNGVQYDDGSHSKITLGNIVTSTPVTLTNVADGKNPSDAVTFRQLSTTRSSVGVLWKRIGTTDEQVGSLSTGMTKAEKRLTMLEANAEDYVGYDGQTRDTLTLGDTVSRRSVRVRNVSKGVELGDAVNFAQLSETNRTVGTLSTGLVRSERKLRSLAVDIENSARYDDASRGMLTLGGTGASSPVALANVADGTHPTDAVNFRQLSETNRNVTSLSTGLKQMASVTPGDSRAVVYDDLRRERVKLGGAAASKPVALTNLAAGVASTDAVNVSQLQMTDSRVMSLSTSASTGIGDMLIAMNSLASRLSASVGSQRPPTDGDSGGALKQTAEPASKQASYVSVNDGGSSKGNARGEGASGSGAMAIGVDASAVGQGSAALGARAATPGANAVAIGHAASAKEADAVAMGAGAVASGAGAVAIGANAVALDPGTVSFGAPGSERRLTNLAPGRRATDAATVGQLAGVQAGVNQVARRAYSGIAAATALAMIPEVDPGRRVAFGVGSATFQGQAAVSIGASVRFTDNLKARLGAGISRQGNTYAAGVSYQW
ncbi:YadA-like family protein [Pandoraea pnomenusa]|uniref:YadA-like family protein n=1 Tax=Pandoraea pnomenusa TaxID=93220 RepID=UPI0018C85F51|nr:YadA-like family protein [Pandoraea pnomenusa]